MSAGTEVATRETPTTSIQEALRSGRERALVLVGQLRYNQGRPTFSGRMTLEEFADLTVIHNRKWAEEAGQSLEVVTQRDIIEAHANGLALFMVQGLVAATTGRAEENKFPESVVMALRRIQDRIGYGAHYGLPQVTLVLQTEPDDITIVRDGKDEVIAARLFLPAGRLMVVADGQHRREAARRVREFLNEVIASRRTPAKVRFYPGQDAPLSIEEVEAWSVVLETFRSWTYISYEAHMGLSVAEARQLFVNYNCHVKPVKADLNLRFDESNPINMFGKELQEELPTKPDGTHLFDLRQLAAINGLLFLGMTTIRSAPYNVDVQKPKAKEFWTTIQHARDWGRADSLLRELPVIKALAKAWFYVFLARRNSQAGKAPQIREYLRVTRFDPDWVETVPGLKTHTVPIEAGGLRFSPAHNDIVAKIVARVLGTSPGSKGTEVAQQLEALTVNAG